MQKKLDTEIIYIYFDRYRVQQTDEEESWTAENFVPKLEECLDALKRIAKKIGTFYNKETYVFVFISLIYILIYLCTGSY